MPCHSTHPDYSCYDRYERGQEPIEIDWKKETIPDNYQEKYPIKMEEIKQLAVLKRENNYLEAALCAILTELENKKLLQSIADAASKNGMIDIYRFWDEHKSKDEERLKAELDKFSEHEKEIIKKLLQ
jgi:tellurite resistance-related uncharacterized protein